MINAKKGIEKYVKKGGRRTKYVIKMDTCICMVFMMIGACTCSIMCTDRSIYVQIGSCVHPATLHIINFMHLQYFLQL